MTAADTTAEHTAACEELWNRAGGFYNGGPFTSFLYHEEGKPSKASLVFPGFTGGANWGGTAIDPNLGYIFVNTKDSPAVGWMVKNPKYTPGSPNGLESFITSAPPGTVGFNAPVHDAEGHTLGTLSCFKPPWGRLIAGMPWPTIPKPIFCTSAPGMADPGISTFAARKEAITFTWLRSLRRTRTPGAWPGISRKTPAKRGTLPRPSP